MILTGWKLLKYVGLLLKVAHNYNWYFLFGSQDGILYTP